MFVGKHRVLLDTKKRLGGGMMRSRLWLKRRSVYSSCGTRT